ncbi:MAG TPA: hypothetical protein VF489_06320 [Sphingobium sp.]
MKLLICLVTPEKALRRFFGRGKDSVVPSDVLKRGAYAARSPQVTTIAWEPEGVPSSLELQRFLLLRGRGAHACVILLDERWAHLATEVRNATFAAPFDATGAADNPQNFFHRLLARALRNIGQIYSKFQNGDDAQLLTLPLRNFHSASLAEIARLCRDEPENNLLSDIIERQLVDLRQCVRPRRRTEYKIKYAVDNKNRFFVYGKERHAQFDTGEPHTPACEIAGLFRFGIRLDERRHYNVSETEGDHTNIEGEFPDCHGAVQSVTSRSHINMFANDFF